MRIIKKLFIFSFYQNTIEYFSYNPGFLGLYSKTYIPYSQISGAKVGPSYKKTSSKNVEVYEFLLMFYLYFIIKKFKKS